MWGITMLALGIIFFVIVAACFIVILVNSIRDKDKKDTCLAAGVIGCILVGAILIMRGDETIGIILVSVVAFDLLCIFWGLVKERDTLGKILIALLFFLLCVGATLIILGIRFKAIKEISASCQRFLT